MVCASLLSFGVTHQANAMTDEELAACEADLYTAFPS
jgi:hypothetical protein